MRDLNDLYKKEGASAAPSASSPAAPSVTEAPPSSEAAAPILETPPGLPQEYIDANLKNQPLPAVMDMASIAQEEKRELNFRRVPFGESMCHATNIPFRPGTEPKIVQDRIDQGPHVFASRAQRDQFDKDFDEKAQEKEAGPKGPTLAHPDTLRPGTFISGESKVYRPV